MTLNLVTKNIHSSFLEKILQPVCWKELAIIFRKKKLLFKSLILADNTYSRSFFGGKKFVITFWKNQNLTKRRDLLVTSPLESVPNDHYCQYLNQPVSVVLLQIDVFFRKYLSKTRMKKIGKIIDLEIGDSVLSSNTIIQYSARLSSLIN